MVIFVDFIKGQERPCPPSADKPINLKIFIVLKNCILLQEYIVMLSKI